MKNPIRIRSLYGACLVLQKIPSLSWFEKSNGIIHSRNEIEEEEEEEDIPRWPRDKNRIGISISFQSEIKGRLNADTLRPIESRVDIAAWKITEGARGRRVRRGSRGKRRWKTNGRRGKGRRWKGWRREKGDWRRIRRWQRGIRNEANSSPPLVSIVFFLSISPSPPSSPATSLFILLAGFCTERRAIYRDMSAPRYSWRRYKVSPSICVGVQVRSQVLHKGWEEKASCESFFSN